MRIIPKRSKVWLLILVSVIGLLVGTFLYVSWQIGASLDRFDRLMANELFKAWIKAGRPEGIAVTEFMQGGDPNIVVSNTVLSVDGKEYQTIFAVLKARSGRVGILFVCKDSTLIWIGENTRPKIESP